jgi:hypothetical protein
MIGISIIAAVIAIILAIIWRVSGRRERAAKRSAEQTEARIRKEELKKLFLSIDFNDETTGLRPESNWLNNMGAIDDIYNVPEEWSLLILQKRGASLKCMSEMVGNRTYRFPEKTCEQFLKKALQAGENELAARLARMCGRHLHVEELAQLREVAISHRPTV